MGKAKQKRTKKRSKRGKKDGKTQPAKKMDDMTNEELNALLIPGNWMMTMVWNGFYLIINQKIIAFSKEKICKVYIICTMYVLCMHTVCTVLK